MSRQPDDTMSLAETQLYANGGDTMVDLSSQTDAKDEPPNTPICGKCQLPVTLENTVLKSLNQKSVTCKACHASSTMMSRHFTSMPPAWDQLSDEERVNFFRSIISKKETASGHLKYKVLRNELKDVLVKKTVEEKKRGYTGEFLPLETYRLRGFDVKKIEELAQKEVHPILGDTYRIDIKRFSEDFIEQSIEESLTQVEKTVKRNQLPEHMRPQPKKKAKAAPKKKGQGKDPEGEAVEEEKEKDEEEENKPAPDPVFVDLMAMESDSDVEVTCQFIFTGLVITCL